MAEAKAKEVKESKAGGSKKMLIMIVVAVLLTAVMAGAVTWFLLGHKKEDPAKGGKKGHEVVASEAHAETGHEEGAAPVFQPIEPIVVNLTGGTESSVMRVAITVQLSNEKDKEKLAAYTPKIQGDLMLLFSSKTQEELLTPEGKVKLIEETKKTINMALGAKKPESGMVKAVSFTEMIIQ